MIQIRPARRADVPQLSDLLTILFTQESELTPDAERQTRGLGLIIAEPQVGRIYCAVDGETVVGMVSILFTVSTAQGGRAAWLEDMIVHPSRRGEGIGEQLLREAIRGAQAAGCTRITLLTDADNTSAQRFYERAGFERSRMLTYRLAL
jgi:ribosomal protein S18 acetylase RimI-like enzyme